VNTTPIANSTGAASTTYTYDPFGKTTSAGAASANPTQFAGRENDGTGLYFNRARYYSPGLQRFISQDPIGMVGSGPNLYGYVGNSPTNFIDPTGLYWGEGAVHAVANVGRKLLANDLVRMTIAGVGAGLICAGTAGIGCAVIAGAVIGATLGGANYALNSKEHTGWGWVGAIGIGAAEGAIAGLASGAGAAEEEGGLVTDLETCNSFTAGTAVLMADGARKDVEDVGVGDHVTGTDPETGATGDHVVTGLIRHDADLKLVDLVIHGAHGDETVTATDHHPFWVTDDGGHWTDAGELHEGNHLRTPDGDRLAVIHTTPHLRQERVYNLTVDGVHSYYVGDGDPILVHNAGACDIADLPESAVRKLTTDADYGFQRLNLNHGVDRIEFGNQIHEIKAAFNLPADFDLWFGPTGDVWNPQTGELLGQIVHGG